MLVSLLTLGFLLGVRHAADPDHVLAVATITSRQRSLRGAALMASLWGLGHSVTLLVVGCAILGLAVTIPPRLGLTMELAVAVMLVLLGVANLGGVGQWIRDHAARVGRRGGAHSHPHRHGDYVHSHPHGHGPGEHGHRDDQTPAARLDRWLGGIGLYRALRPLAVGVVHGLAGSAGLTLLVLATIPEPAWAVAYLAVFGLGTVAGMLVITLGVATPFVYGAARGPRAGRYLTATTGLASLGFGLFLIYRVGFVEGLFIPQ